MNIQTPASLMLLLALTPPVLAADAPAQPTTTPTTAPAVTPAAAPAKAPDTDTTGAPVAASAKLTLDFRGAKLGKILDYLSSEAGYILVNPVELPGPVTLVAKQPLTPAEAVEALNAVLFDQGYAVLVRGRALRVVKLSEAKQQNLQVASGADPAKMPESDRMVTQVIPVRFAAVKDLAENLQPLLNPSYSTLAANESSNTLILTDTQSNVRRIAAIVNAIDGAISGDQQIKVFHLSHASSDKVAQVLTTIYATKSSGGSGGSQDVFRAFMGGGGGGRGSGGGSSGGGKSSGSDAASGGGHAEQVMAASDSGTNSVVVRASANSLAALAVVIEQLDVDTTAREGVLVYPVKNGKSADLAKSMNDLFSGTTSGGGTTTAPQRNGVQNRQTTQGGSSSAPSSSGSAAAGGDSLDLTSQVRVVSDELSNSVLVLTQERNFERIQGILKNLDRPMRQVLVRVLVAEVTVQKGLDVGVELQGINPAADANSTRAFSSFNLFDSTLGMNGYLLDNNSFRAAVRALATATRFDVLSRPYILTTDNREAVVNVSQNVPVINGTRTDQNNNVTSTFDRQDVGIILKVTPQINSEGRVVLDVNQVLSALSDQSIPVAKDVSSTIINKREMTTRVAVDSGQTIVIGGLVRDDFTETVQKVPLLGDIPWVGELFKRTKRTKSQTELLVFLTPQVIQSPEELASMTRQLRNEMQHLSNAVEPGVLDRHLRQLQGLKVGVPVAPGTVLAPITVPPASAEPKTSPSTLAGAATRADEASEKAGDKPKETHP